MQLGITPSLNRAMGFVPDARRIKRAQQHIAAGYRWVVNLDLEKFFDRVNHDRLMGQMAWRAHDKRLCDSFGAGSRRVCWRTDS
jgi:hypothetical protein